MEITLAFRLRSLGYRPDPIFGGISVALAKMFKFIDAELKAVHTEEWERTFSLFRLLI